MKERKIEPFVLFVLILFLVIGIGLLVGATTTIIVRHNKYADYIRIEATVIKYDEDNKHLIAEVVRYNVEGKLYEATSPVHTSDPKKIGEKILVAYNPNDYSDYVFIKSLNHFYIGMYILGTAFTCISSISLIKGLYKK